MPMGAPPVLPEWQKRAPKTIWPITLSVSWLCRLHTSTKLACVMARSFERKQYRRKLSFPNGGSPIYRHIFTRPDREMLSIVSSSYVEAARTTRTADTEARGSTLPTVVTRCSTYRTSRGLNRESCKRMTMKVNRHKGSFYFRCCRGCDSVVEEVEAKVLSTACLK